MEQGHNCGTDCSALADQFKAEIAAWAQQDSGSSAAVECSGDGSLRYTTGEQTIPTSLGSTPIKLTFAMKDGTPALADAVFQVEVVRFTNANESDPGSYQIRYPTLAILPQGGSNIRVTRLNVLFDGKERPEYRAWAATDFVVEPRIYSVNAPLNGWYPINDSPEIVNWVSSAGDKVSFSFSINQTNAFASVPTVNPFSCKSLSRFRTFYDNKKGSCLGCHGGNNMTAFSKFPMSSNADAITCQEFKRRADTTTVLNSLFYLFPQNIPRTPPDDRVHPESIPFSQTDRTNITDWLNNEK